MPSYGSDGADKGVVSSLYQSTQLLDEYLVQIRITISASVMRNTLSPSLVF